MTQREDSYKFEFNRIKALQEERLHIQKKTFTKWMNSFLQKARMEVDDIFTDLTDGKRLLRLLEIISGEKLGKPNNGKMRVHKIENVNKSLAFLHTKFRLESIGAEDIVDGNKRLILGLLWTIILRFQIQDIEIEMDEENSEKKHAKEALLLWCQRKTAGYPCVEVRDFTQSWRSGMAFNALIHAHRPDLIDYNELNPHNHIDSLNNAFDVAEKDLGVSKLLDAEDVDTAKPDEKSVMTYVSSYYHTFAKMNSEMKGGRRIANIIAQLIDIDRSQLNYELFTTNLLNWIQMKIIELEDRKLPNSLEGIQREFLKFKEYRTVEKPPKYMERSEIEALLFNIQTKMKSLGQPLYSPPDGKLCQDIEKSWTALEKAEYRREVALREEFVRLEKLENLAFSFERKSVLREGYLKEMIQVLSDPRYGSDLTQVEATVKKHEAISADILARSERFKGLAVMAQELIDGNYHSKDNIKAREQQITYEWKQLLDLLKQHQNSLNAASSLVSSLREVDTIRNEIKEMEKTLSSDSNVVVQHLLAVDDLLQRHTLLEAQIASQGETIRKLNKISNNLMLNDADSDAIQQIKNEASVLVKRLETLNNEYLKLKELAKQKRSKLEETRSYYQFVQDVEEEEATLSERQRICQAILPSKDLLGIISLQQKHSVLETEIKAHKNRLKKVIESGNKLIEDKHPESDDIKTRIDSLTTQWDKLHELADQKTKQLSDAIEAFQYHADANETESWMKEKTQLVTSEDYGKDEPSALALLQRHSRLESEISAYENDIKRLNTQSDKMLKSGIASLFMICGDAFSAATAAGGGDIDEVDKSEEWVEELIEKEVVQDVVEEIRIPQVMVLYPFSGQDTFAVNKNENLILLQKTNNDWWNVRKEKERRDGFVPANYVKEIEPKVVKKLVKKPIKVWEKQRVKRPINKKSKKQNKRNSKRRLSIICDAESVEQRKKNINSAFDELIESCKIRRQYLEDAIQLFRFNRECDGFETWIKDTEKAIVDITNNYQQQKSQNNELTDPIEKLRKKFENYITELSANRYRLDDIDKMANEFTCGRAQHYSAVIKQRQSQIHKKWEKLNRLMTELGKNVEGLTTVEMFNTTCDETAEWMLEKLEKIDEGGDFGKDLKTVQALHRRHDNIERELAPVEEKFNKVVMLADSVKSSYPMERQNVTVRQTQLAEIWERVKERANERRAKLDESLGLQVLKNSATDLLNWIRSNVKQNLNSDDINLAKDVSTVEHLLEKHEDLGKEIAAKNEDFNDLRLLGKQLIKQMGNEEVLPILNELNEEQDAIHRGWQEKNNWLRQCKDLMIFNQEADQLDTLTNSHLTFLEFDDLGMTLDDVEALIKRHDTFIATLLAQDERLHVFNDMAEKLIDAKHYDSVNIDSKRKQVIERRVCVKEKALLRKQLLTDALEYQELKADAEDFQSWCSDKMKVANDDSYKDLQNMERKVQKHEAFEAELASNQSRLTSIREKAEDLISNSHLMSKDIKSIVQTISDQWIELCSLSDNKGKHLRQAYNQLSYNKSVERAKQRLEELSIGLDSDQMGTDLRSCKELIKKHLAVESEVEMWSKKIMDLSQTGQQMAQNHFDGQNILNSCELVSDRFDKLKTPLVERKTKLLESFKFYELEFEINAELQWIREHMSLANSKSCGHNLTDAQNMIKKFKQNLLREVDGHEKHIEKTLTKTEQLINGLHYRTEELKEKSSELQLNWNQLKQLVSERKRLLEISLKVQQLLSEASEVESWISEKLNIVQSPDLGKDSNTAIKLLTKQKAIELEVDTYSVIIQEMIRHSKQLIQQLIEDNSKQEQKRIIESRMQDIDQQMKRLQRMANQRCHRLIQSKHLHEFIGESNELLEWIVEQTTIALSEEFGKDYEHLLQIQSKFVDFKRKVVSFEDRYNTCVESGQKLSKSQDNSESSFGSSAVHSLNSTYETSIESQINKLSHKWNQLMEALEAREHKLTAAGKIHRFNRDVAEALSRIGEKFSVINSKDLGKDLHSVESLIRKHEVFENDLVALEAQLQVLIDDSVRLQALYPGGNAQHIVEQQKIVVEHWTALQESVVIRKQQLQQSYQLQALMASVRDLENWALSLDKQMDTIDKVSCAQSAQLIKVDHQRIKAEIETREQLFSSVLETAKLIESQSTPHYANDEIQYMVNKVLQLRTGLHNKWQLKKVYLDQLIDVHFFIRDCKQLEQLSQQQESRLQSDDLGLTVEEVEQNLRKHEAFEKVVYTHEEKLSALQESGLKLIKQNHFESQLIQSKLDDITNRRTKVKEICFNRRQRLKDALILAQFRRDVIETDNWIQEKDKQLDQSIKHSMDLDINLEEKIKQLQKHQSFQLELQANSLNIKDIKQKADHLISKSHENSLEVRSQFEQLIHKWNQLLHKSEQRGRGLEEAQDILDFNQNVEKVESWIRDKELMVNLSDTGEDFEHCLSLQRKLDDVDSDMRVDDKRIKQINTLADKLMKTQSLIQMSQTSQQPSHSSQIQRRRDLLNEKWKHLQIQIDSYRNKLSNALDVHRFNRDLCDLNEIISEKSLILDKEDEAKNLEGVEALQRKQEAIEREVNSIELRLKDLIESEGRKLINKYPDMTVNCRNKINEVQDNWRQLNHLCHYKRNRLSSAYTLHKFLKEVKEYEIWAQNMINRRMRGQSKEEDYNIENSIADVRNDLQLHEDIKSEIMARKENLQYLKEFGHKLLQENNQQKNSSSEQLNVDNNPNRQLIETNLIKLDELRRSLDQVWEERKHYLTQSLQLQLFNELFTQSDDWLSTKEAFLNNEDLGDSLAGVESLIRKHQNFEKTLLTQQRITELGKFATDLVEKSHFDSENILSKYRSTVQRKDRLLESSKQRKTKLNDSKLFHKFCRNVNEILGWLNEKLCVASDESYRDPINLLSKIQKHAAFEAELAANKGRVDGVVNEGEGLISSGHFLSDEIQTHLSYIEKSWRLLLDETKLKRERLQDAYQALQFHRMLDDLQVWMTEIETILADEDHGKDLISAQNIMKKHQLVENDINNHSENIEQVKDLTTAFNQNNHFMKEEIEQRAHNLIQRFESLHEPMQIRRENLEEALLLFQFKRDIDDELIWIEEKQTQVMATDLGQSLLDVQKLRKKHQLLEAEISAREPILTTIISKGHSLLRSQHFASNEIEGLITELQNRVQSLKDGAAIRRLRLLDAIESQQFYSDALEADNWLTERMPFLESEDTGKDEESVIVLTKKLDLIKRDSERFVSTNFNKLFQLGNGLIERNHFDSQLIQTKINELDNKFKHLNDLCHKKSEKLSENRKHFGFLRDADELLHWIKEQMIIACSEDYGQDVEHVELLIQRFDNFIINLNSNEERITCLRTTAEGLKENNEKLNQVLIAWNELKDMAQSRQDALHGAKQVHTFDRSADETIAWIHEKDSSTALDETNSPDDDLQSIQAMIRSHEGFEQDLRAVREQVEALVEEAKRLASLFPDASEHIFAKNDQVNDVWNQLLQRSAQRRHHLNETETLQTYFDEYRELMASINELIALITADDELANDVVSAESQVHRHKEYKMEIDARNDSFVKFVKEGEVIISSGHFMSGEVRERIDRLNSAHKNLIDIWNKRRVLYEHNLDAQQFKHDAQQLERWIASKEDLITDPNLGDSIADVEDLIRKHEDFEKAIIAQEEKLKSIQRLTLIEEDFRQQKLEEERMKMADIARKEQERVQQLKQKEQMRILDERRHEDDMYDKNGDVRKSSHESDGNPKGLVKRVENLLVPKAVRRAESVKFASPKRTPSFTTRRRSFRSTKVQSVEPDQLPPVECEGVLDRKQELQTGGKRATVRSWKTYYTVLCGQLLCFFKDKDSFFGNLAAAPPFSVLGAKCSRAVDYTKRKYVFRLQLSDGTEYLFTTGDEARLQEWLNKLAFHASLPPSMQLLSYDAHKDASIYSRASNTSLGKQSHNDSLSPQQSTTVPKYTNDTSSQSSSSPEYSRKSSVSSNPMGSTSVNTSRPSIPVPPNNYPPVAANDPNNRRAPPLPPPRTTNPQKSSPEPTEVPPEMDNSFQRPMSDGYDHKKEEIDNQRRNQFRQSYPQRDDRPDTHQTNGNHNNLNEEMYNPYNVYPMSGSAPNSTYQSFNRPAYNMPMPVQNPYSMYALPTYNETDSETEEWLSQRLDLRYAQTTYQNIPVARHMSLPPNTYPPNQLEPTYASGQSIVTNLTTSSEEEIPNSHKTKKKGVMGFFKRNK